MATAILFFPTLLFPSQGRVHGPTYLPISDKLSLVYPSSVYLSPCPGDAQTFVCYRDLCKSEYRRIHALKFERKCPLKTIPLSRLRWIGRGRSLDNIGDHHTRRYSCDDFVSRVCRRDCRMNSLRGIKTLSKCYSFINFNLPFRIYIYIYIHMPIFFWQAVQNYRSTTRVPGDTFLRAFSLHIYSFNTYLFVWYIRWSYKEDNIFIR